MQALCPENQFLCYKRMSGDFFCEIFVIMALVGGLGALVGVLLWLLV